MTELPQQEPDHSAVSHDKMATGWEFIEELFDAIPERPNGLAAGSREAIEGDQAVLGALIEIVEPQTFDLPKVEFAESFLESRFTRNYLSSLHTPPEIRAPQLVIANPLYVGTLRQHLVSAARRQRWIALAAVASLFG